MIHGDGVMGKFKVIVAGRQQELYTGISYEQRAVKDDELFVFMTLVRNSTPTEFEEWFQLYADSVRIPDNKSRKAQ